MTAGADEGLELEPWHVLIRIEPDRRMRRFYVVMVTRALGGGGFMLIREWGRIGSPGRIMEAWYPDLERANAAARALVRSKRARGYGPGCPGATWNDGPAAAGSPLPAAQHITASGDDSSGPRA